MAIVFGILGFLLFSATIGAVLAGDAFSAAVGFFGSFVAFVIALIGNSFIDY